MPRPEHSQASLSGRFTTLGKRSAQIWSKDIWLPASLKENSPRGWFFACLRIVSISITVFSETKVASRAAALSFSSLLSLGPMVAISDDDALHLLEFADRTALPSEIARLRSRSGLLLRHGRNRPIDQIEAELNAYFAGTKLSFDTPVVERGTDFERSVWRELRRIPAGETRSYRDIANALGRDNAERAVARANGANQLALVIPCHRVIASDGALSGYGGKIWRKRWLLEHERRVAAS